MDVSGQLPILRKVDEDRARMHRHVRRGHPAAAGKHCCDFSTISRHSYNSHICPA